MYHKMCQIALILLLVLSVLVTTGCGFISQFLPGVPFSPAYIVNRDGSYFVGSRCSDELVEIGVFMAWPTGDSTDPHYFDTAIWYAIADPSVNEFELAASGQSAVTVIRDTGTVLASGAPRIQIKDRDGHQSSLQGNGPLDPIQNGMAGSSAGLMTWNKFMRMPSSDFGC